MLTEEKINQTKKLLSRGYPEGEVKLQLKEEGYTEQEIGNIFKPRTSDMRSWFLFFGVVFVITGLYLLIKQNEWHLLLFGCGLLGTFFTLNQRHKKALNK